MSNAKREWAQKQTYSKSKNILRPVLVMYLMQRRGYVESKCRLRNTRFTVTLFTILFQMLRVISLWFTLAVLRRARYRRTCLSFYCVTPLLWYCFWVLQRFRGDWGSRESLMLLLKDPNIRLTCCSYLFCCDCCRTHHETMVVIVYAHDVEPTAVLSSSDASYHTRKIFTTLPRSNTQPCPQIHQRHPPKPSRGRLSFVR